MPIKIRETYEIITPESAEFGDVAERGFIDEEGEEYSFRELVELLAHCAPSSSCPHNGMWATHYDYDVDYETGATESRSYHPVTERDSRYFNLACIFAGIIPA